MRNEIYIVINILWEKLFEWMKFSKQMIYNNSMKIILKEHHM